MASDRVAEALDFFVTTQNRSERNQPQSRFSTWIDRFLPIQPGMDTNLSPLAHQAVSAAVIDQLARTKGWTRFFSVMLWIGAGFLVLGGIAVMFLGAFAGAMGEEVNSQFAAVGGAAVIGAIYIALSLLYIYPALKLGSYSSRITELMEIPSEANLVAALDQQRAFWKYLGVSMIILFAFYAVMVVVTIGVIGFGAASAASGS